MTQTPHRAHRVMDPERTPLAWPEEPLRVRDLMSVSPLTIAPSTSVYAARTLMLQGHIRHLPILEDGHLVGIVSDRDLRLVLPSPATSLTVWESHYLLARLTVGEVMTRFVMTVAPDRPATEAVRRMVGQKVGALPVVEGGQLVGILTRTDVLHAVLRGGAPMLLPGPWQMSHRHREKAGTMHIQGTYTMLYVGHRARGHAFAAAVQSRGWQVYVPAVLFEALGMYVFYAPHFVVIDDALVQSSLAREVGAYLLSIQAPQLLVVTDERRQAQWQGAAVAAIGVLPRTARMPDVVPAMVDLIVRSIKAQATEGHSAGEDGVPGVSGIIPSTA